MAKRLPKHLPIILFSGKDNVNGASPYGALPQRPLEEKKRDHLFLVAQDLKILIIYH
ncbi:hypothetical protein Glove_428g25 [Diversispora epigaea]|uniref:Uncharacterized protein n=1 Tax=Diversispora epigaea TaxID=1348612 RepID=A0A397GU51_9GLOM|nr:hypothetical protein Glove_428g25 [Diversispora epigaea]